MARLKSFIKDVTGDVVVEAAILLPILIMIFAALVLLSMYLPTRAILQQATQFTATAIATEKSDAWLYFDENAMEYRFHTSREDLNNVYVDLFKSFWTDDDAGKAESIVSKTEEKGISAKSGNLTVAYEIENYVVYKEIIVTATRTLPVPVNLSLINFPNEIPITVTSTAVVQNGDEFIRNMDLAVDFVDYVSEKYGFDEFFKSLKEIWGKCENFLGW